MLLDLCAAAVTTVLDLLGLKENTQAPFCEQQTVNSTVEMANQRSSVNVWHENV